MTEDQQQQLSALLRLKRFEQPPQGYYEKLLQDVHRRQRADLLHRPAWKLMLERVQTFFSQHSFGYGSYAGATAAVVLVACGIFVAAMPHKPATAIASATAPMAAPAMVADAEPVNLRRDHPVHAVLSLQESPVVVASAVDSDSIMRNERLIPSAFSQGNIRPARQPRYVIDTVPVSYEATQVSFNF